MSDRRHARLAEVRSLLNAKRPARWRAVDVSGSQGSQTDIALVLRARLSAAARRSGARGSRDRIGCDPERAFARALAERDVGRAARTSCPAERRTGFSETDRRDWSHAALRTGQTHVTERRLLHQRAQPMYVRGCGSRRRSDMLQRNRFIPVAAEMAARV